MKSILLIGNPNSGKTLLFNQLTGLTQKVANYPGITVEIRTGHFHDLTFHDFPGAYSLKPLTKDEKVAVQAFEEALHKPETKVILYVVDSTRLERSLYLLLQVIEEARAMKCPVVVAANIMDEVLSKGASVDLKGLEEALQCPVVGISAKKGTGIQELKKILSTIASKDREGLPQKKDSEKSSLETIKDRSRFLDKKYGPLTDILIKSQYRLDRFFLSSGWGPFVFMAIMIFLFQAIFTWAAPLMDFFSSSIEWLGGWVSSQAPPGFMADFISDAIFGGVGSFIVFVPQIFILFLVIGFLEDSGYLARAAVICHRPLSWFGLSGRSFVPLLSGFACAIPAILSTRSIESPRKRLLTMVAIPFMACSARLPVYALLIGAFIPVKNVLGGLIGLQGLTFFLLYAFGILSGLVISGLLNRALKTDQDDTPFIVEMPPYRFPSFKTVFRHALQRTTDFVKTAALIIFIVTAIIWILGYFPYGTGHLDQSILGFLGKLIEPAFAPMGMDWKIGVAILTSFAAREVFVATLGTLYGLGTAADQMETLTHTLQHTGFSLATAISLLVFYALAMQCASTLAVMRKEAGSNKVPILVFVGLSLLAYSGAWLAYHIVS